MRGDDSMSIDSDTVVHRQPAAGRRLEVRGGRVHKGRNQVGSGGDAPRPPVFLPPPSEELPRLLEDLIAFGNGRALHPSPGATIPQASSEKECSLAEGIGTKRRSLNHLLVRLDRDASEYPPLVSVVLASRVKDVMVAMATRNYVARPDSCDSCEAINRWAMVFATAARTAVQDASRFERKVQEIQATWLAEIGNPKRESTVRLLVEVLPAAPVMTAVTASELTGRTFQATNMAILQLVAAGILAQTSVGRRNRSFAAPELVDAYSWLESKLVTPSTVA